jgi:hypothetical protein
MKIYREYLLWIVLPCAVTFCLLLGGAGVLLWSRVFVDPVQVAYKDYRDVSHATIKLAEAECVKVEEQIKRLRLTIETLPVPLEEE